LGVSTISAKRSRRFRSGTIVQFHSTVLSRLAELSAA
jgi:hypothetical protein